MSVAIAVAAFALGASPAAASKWLDDDFGTTSDTPFATYSVGAPFADGQTFGRWTADFSGGGNQQIVVDDGGNHQLQETPATSSSAAETHSALTTSVQTFGGDGGNYTITAEYGTLQQLRTGSPANPWEVAQLLWNYSDNNHFYALVLKPNGWEIDKEYVDPSGHQAQDFLATGTDHTFPIGSWNRVVLTQCVTDGVPTFTVRVKHGRRLVKLASVTDDSAPYVSGKLGLYTEDAQVWWGWLAVR